LSRPSNHAPFHILLLGMSGHIFLPFSSTLVALGVPTSVVSGLLRKLHEHALRFADSLVRLRRRLEWSSELSFDPP
jgi:hypothetical protein